MKIKIIQTMSILFIKYTVNGLKGRSNIIVILKIKFINFSQLSFVKVHFFFRNHDLNQDSSIIFLKLAYILNTINNIHYKTM